MAARIRFCREAGETLGASVERLADGKYWTGQPAPNDWGPVNAAATAPLAEGPTLSPPGFAGSYELTIPTAATAGWPDGNYAARVHNGKANNLVIGVLGFALHGGDDQPFYPAFTIPPGTKATLSF